MRKTMLHPSPYANLQYNETHWPGPLIPVSPHAALKFSQLTFSLSADIRGYGHTSANGTILMSGAEQRYSTEFDHSLQVYLVFG